MSKEVYGSWDVMSDGRGGRWEMIIGHEWMIIIMDIVVGAC